MATIMYCGICQREVDRLEKGKGRPIFKTCDACRRALEREGAICLCDLSPSGYAYRIVPQGFDSVRGQGEKNERSET